MKLLLKNVTQNHKKSLNEKKHKNYKKLPTEYWKMAHLQLQPQTSSGKKTSINHPTHIEEDTVCVCTKKIDTIEDPDENL